jgi:urease accessory protein
MNVGIQLGLLRLVSPALPVGAFAYSRGLEGAVAAGLVHDETSLGDWIVGVLEHVLCPLDGGMLVRMHAAWQQDDLARVQAWSLQLRAFRESHELLLEDEQMGNALARMLRGVGIADADRLEQPGYTCVFALAAVRWGIAPRDALAGLFWAFCEGQVGAALRLLPVGQSAGQRILERALPVIERCVPRALALSDDELGSYAPGLARCSARHELQYSRLFRS